MATTLFFSCKQKDKHLDPNKQVDEGTVKGETYVNEDIGWTIVIPKGWTVISRDQTEASEKKGVEAAQKASHMKIDISELKHLISYQKDRFNSFMSTIEPLPNPTPEGFEENFAAVGKMIYDTYTAQGIKSDTSTRYEVIRGRRFHIFQVTIYNQAGKPILQQQIYIRRFGERTFSATFSYTNEALKKIMMDAFRNSSFRGE